MPSLKICLLYTSTLAVLCFQKLPHPLSGVLQKLSVVDGIDEDGLLVFLDLVLQLADFPGVSDGEVLSLISVSYTHLDVYKRQVFNWLKNIFNNVIFKLTFR